MELFEYCFAKHREKAVKGYRLLMYYLQMWEILMNQFEYTGLPESLPAEWIEGYLITNGSCGFGEKDGKLFVATGGYSGALNGYTPEDYIAAIPAKGNIEGVAEGAGSYDVEIKDKVVVVGWNNTSHSPEFELIDVAAALCEGRTSEDLNVLFSRFLRIPIAHDEKEKAVIESAIKAIIEGKVEAISSNIPFFDMLENGGVGERQFLDLVDVKEVDKLQYLNQYFDNILKRFMRRHGISMNITNKLAQQTNSEMHGADDFSMIYPLVQRKYRKQMINDLNNRFGEKYGFHADVEFSKIWQNSYDKVINYIPDELNEKEVIEGVENTVDTVEKTTEDESAGVENEDK